MVVPNVFDCHLTVEHSVVHGYPRIAMVVSNVSCICRLGSEAPSTLTSDGRKLRRSQRWRPASTFSQL